MKKVFTLIFLVVMACDNNEDPSPKTEFRIDTSEDGYLLDLWVEFAKQANTYSMPLPTDNLILRYVNDSDTFVNNSKWYYEGPQLYVDIDYGFIQIHTKYAAEKTTVVFQQLANALFNLPFKTCRGMWKIDNADDIKIHEPTRDFSSIDFFQPYSC